VALADENRLAKFAHHRTDGTVSEWRDRRPTACALSLVSQQCLRLASLQWRLVGNLADFIGLEIALALGVVDYFGLRCTIAAELDQSVLIFSLPLRGCPRPCGGIPPSNLTE
jgi:hypothetical protein